jgi:hypothetical protein
MRQPVMKPVPVTIFTDSRTKAPSFSVDVLGGVASCSSFGVRAQAWPAAPAARAFGCVLLWVAESDASVSDVD